MLGAVATYYGPINSFFFSGLFFLLGFTLSLMASMLNMCCKKSIDETSNETSNKAEESDFDKNLINKA